MKFTVELPPLVKMVELVGKKMPGTRRADASLRLLAVSGRVFVESNQTVAGVEGLVLADGQCSLPREKFLGVLKTYKGRANLMVEVSAAGLCIGGFQMRVNSYSSQVQPPAHFQGIPATNLATLLPSQSAAKPEPAK